MGWPVFVSEDSIRQTLPWPVMIAKLREVYSVEHPPFAGPPRTLARGKGIWMRTLTGVLPDGSVMGTKQFCFPRSKTVRYVITLFDQESGELLAFLDGRSRPYGAAGPGSALPARQRRRSGRCAWALLDSGWSLWPRRAIQAG